MPDSSGKLMEVEASLLWDQLSERIDAFISAWEAAPDPPPLVEFLPETPPALRRLTLVEAIKVDLEYRWKERRWPKLLEQYLAEFPELAAEGSLPCDVIYEEFHVRKQQGEAVSIGEYCSRFPGRVDELRRLFDLESPEQTTALVPAERVPSFEAGERIDDFDLLAPLGKGAFATVFLARQISMQRMVALKISADRGHEPQTLAQLDHPHIVRVFDQRQLAERRLRLLYMQYIAGGTLQGVVEHARRVPPTMRNGGTLLAAIDRALEKRGEQPPTDSMARYRLQNATWPEVVCWLGGRLAGALAYAHERGVLHRDVKPANVLVGADGHPKLADFNISFSKLDGATPAAYFGGSLAYMSPEQLEACDPGHSRQPEELDGRSDVYSLGVLLWELLTLKRPFAEEALPETWSQTLARMARVRHAGITSAARATVPAGCPAAIVEVLEKCLAPDPADRYASAAELARQLDLCLQPRAHALLHARRGRRSAFKQHPVTSTILFGLLPNVLMSVLNIAFNVKEFVGKLSPEDQSVFFGSLVLGINAAAYTLGLGYVCVTRGRVFLTLARLAARGEKVAPPPSVELVWRCLTLGFATAGVTALLWTISGVVVPAWMQFGAGSTSQVAGADYGNFVVSQLLCGMIAATQSYYVVTFFAVHFCAPWLLHAGAADARESADLAKIARRGRMFLGLTFAVPFVALLALLGLSSIELVALDDRTVLGGLAGLGLVGCGLAYWLELTIRADLAALAGTMNPSNDTLLAGDTVDSFLTGSRR